MLYIFFIICAILILILLKNKWVKFTVLITSCVIVIMLISFPLPHLVMTSDHKQAAVEDVQLDNVQVVKLREQVSIDVPLIEQLPELPRGCEVTSLAMLLESANLPVDKMQLAKEIRRNPAKQVIKNGQIHFGDPNNGFVGDMYSFQTPGLGVYHEPIIELAEKYLPGKIVNLSNRPFNELKIPLSDGRPVWVIINTHYEKLADDYFQTWYTESGPIQITRKQHSVLITGYDERYIYFNDPLNRESKAPINDFEQSWVQMGSHAITYTN